MNAKLKLLWIETRRNPGLWLFPFVAALVIYTTFETLPKDIWLWAQTGVAIRDTLLLVGPIAAGMASWAAGRNRRRGIEELLTTTPRPAAGRDLNVWGATVLWYSLAYLLSAASIMFLAYRSGAWGSPVLWPILLGRIDNWIKPT